jgi:nitrogen fixation NifU-like protein
MSEEKIQSTTSSLFSEVLLDHFRHPRNYGALTGPDITYEHFNPLCGDRVVIELAVDGDTITEARFRGDACAICIAAASILTELIKGKDINDDEAVSPEDLLSALQSDIKPSRLKCALLPLEAVNAGIKLYADRLNSRKK